MLNGLDIFSGIGGFTLALAPWVRPIAYCENDRYAQSVLLSRIATSELPWAPIWDDVRTLLGSFSKPIDIIYGGFPCEDRSLAGPRFGLEGKRSSLFWEIVRLTKEISPTFVFIENLAESTKRRRWKPCEMRLKFLDSSVVTGILPDGMLVLPLYEKDGFYWPTPTARDYRSPGVMKSRLKWKTGMSLSFFYKRNFGVNLPATVPEWMMGFRRGHTVLELWARQWYRSRLGKRSKD